MLDAPALVIRPSDEESRLLEKTLMLAKSEGKRTRGPQRTQMVGWHITDSVDMSKLWRW